MTIASKGRFFTRHVLAKKKDLNLLYCLQSGQSFTWTRQGGFWINILQGELIILSDGQDDVVIWVHHDQNVNNVIDICHKYFRLDYDLADLYKGWSQADEHFRKQAKTFPGIRLLRQDPFEALISFICSQNNGIARIMSMLISLKTSYGKAYDVYLPSPMGTTEGKFECSEEHIVVHAFPEPLVLFKVKNLAQELIDVGFGYRAGYVEEVAKMVASVRIADCRDVDKAPTLDLKDMMTEPYEVVFDRLLKVKGIGPKVADCIALTGLNQMCAVPIDTHIWQIAKKHYKGMPGTKSLTIKAYKAIGEKFRSVFGPFAGWAHLVLFAAKIREKRVRS